MNETLLGFYIEGNKLWVHGDGATDKREFYLPDCTATQLIEFMREHVDNAASMLAVERPWRNRKDG